MRDLDRMMGAAGLVLNAYADSKDMAGAVQYLREVRGQILWEKANPGQDWDSRDKITTPWAK